jgi:hypothetical protein
MTTLAARTSRTEESSPAGRVSSSSRRGSGHGGFTMELIDQLLAILVGPNRSGATRQLMAAGYTEDEVRGAWNFAPGGRLYGVNRPRDGQADPVG